MVLGLSVVGNQARAEDSHRLLFTRDAAYEQYLHVRSNPDEKITPARVMRWMMGFRGSQVIPPSSTEFQPIVDANNHQVRLIAALAYKFF